MSAARLGSPSWLRGWVVAQIYAFEKKLRADKYKSGAQAHSRSKLVAESGGF